MPDAGLGILDGIRNVFLSGSLHRFASSKGLLFFLDSPV